MNYAEVGHAVHKYTVIVVRQSTTAYVIRWSRYI